MPKVSLNIGCGLNKLEGFINIDCDEKLEPDLVLDITKGLPYPDDTVERIYMAHTIEHINEGRHGYVLEEVWRVLEPGGTFFISYPEFKVLARYYLDNYHGQRDFWKKAIFGRQLTPSDTHVALMDTDYFTDFLIEIGFHDIKIGVEPDQEFNTIIKCIKGEKPTYYEEVVQKEIYGDKG